MERQAKDGTIYKQVGQDQWTPVTRTAKDGTVYKKMGEDSWAPMSDATQPERETSLTSTATRKALQGASAGFLDEASGAVEATGRALGFEGLGGSFSDIKRAEGGPTLDKETLKQSYQQGRDRKREMLAQDSKDYPVVSTVSEIAGGFVNPANKIVKGMSMAKGGATLGGLYGLGNSEAEDVGGMAVDTATGAGTGLILGKGVEKATPYIAKGAAKVSEAASNLKQKVGEKTKDFAERMAFKSSGAMLKDWRAAESRDKVNTIGRWMLDKGVVKAGSTVDDVAEAAAREQSKAALMLDEIYTSAGEKLSGSGKGFDPIRDKERIMAAAKVELGDTVGGEASLNQLSNYIDDLAARHGDKPNQALQNQFKRDVSRYKQEFRNYLKDKKNYEKSFGQAADDSQQMLQGFTDDSQRAVSGQRQIEVQGKPASNLSAEGAEYGQQMNLVELPQAQQGQFNAARGDDLLPLNQKMVLDNRTGQMIRNESQQGSIQGTDLVPRSMRTVESTSVQPVGRGQFEMNFQPNRPAAPVRPQEVRNPLSPRRANEIKGAFDDQINYSRNPLTKEPAKEKVFSGARRELNSQILESIDSIDDKVLGDALRATNKDYGNAAQITRIAKDRNLREQSNKMFGLTDTIAAAGSGAVSLATGNPIPLLATLGGKKIVEKYGTSTAAVVLDRVSKRLLKNPEMSRLAKVNPQEFNAAVIRIADYLDNRGNLGMPKAADNERPKKGPDKWVLDGIDKLNQAGIQSSEIEKIKSSKKGRDLLIRASDLSPDSKAMKKLVEQIRTSSKDGE